MKRTNKNSLLKKINIISGNIYGTSSIKLNELIDKKKWKNSNVCIINLQNRHFFTDNVKSEINYYCNIFNKKDKSFKKTIEKRLSILEMDLSVLDKKISELSNSEKNLFYIFINTLFDYDLYIINSIFDWADRNNQKRIKKLLLIIKEEKKILITDNNINGLFDFCDYFIYLMNNNDIVYISKNEMPDYLKKLVSDKQDIPDVLYLTYLAKNDKKIKLTYYSDVRDVIKDIYKHV